LLLGTNRAAARWGVWAIIMAPPDVVTPDEFLDRAVADGILSPSQRRNPVLAPDMAAITIARDPIVPRGRVALDWPSRRLIVPIGINAPKRFHWMGMAIQVERREMHYEAP
jgi:hypothetical protein